MTSAVVIVCSVIYLVCLLFGYDSFEEICFLPSAIVSYFQVYRFYTAIFFHGSLLHVMFNMLALVPLGSELERIMGSVRLLYMIILLATTNAIFNMVIALVSAHNPIYRYPFFMNECAIGFSGVLFSMIVMETSLSGVQSRSVFGLFNVPAKWYVWILLVVFQLLMTNVSFLGHLCGILSGFAYTYGLFNILMPGANFFSAIESASWLSTCVRRPKFILCSGGSTTGYIPTYAGQNTSSSGVTAGNVWNHLSSWMPQRDASPQSAEDRRFPGRGRTLAASRSDPVPSDSSLQARLLDNNEIDPPTDATAVNVENRRQSTVNNAAEHAGVHPPTKDPVASSEDIQKLVAMGFDKTQVEVALAAADGDLDVAVEILMSQHA